MSGALAIALEFIEILIQPVFSNVNLGIKKIMGIPTELQQLVGEGRFPLFSDISECSEPDDVRSLKLEPKPKYCDITVLKQSHHEKFGLAVTRQNDLGSSSKFYWHSHGYQNKYSSQSLDLLL